MLVQLFFEFLDGVAQLLRARIIAVHFRLGKLAFQVGNLLFQGENLLLQLLIKLNCLEFLLLLTICSMQRGLVIRKKAKLDRQVRTSLLVCTRVLRLDHYGRNLAIALVL